MRRAKTLTLDDGTLVKCRPVPPYAYQDMYLQFPRPPYPKEEMKSAAGHTETRPALEGDPVLAEYMEQMAMHRQLMLQHTASFKLNYGVVAWKFTDSDDWEHNPPKDWRPPSVMEQYGVDVDNLSDPELRVMYIKHELIMTEKDEDAIEAVLEVVSVDKEALQAAVAPLGSNTESETPESQQSPTTPTTPE